jgi:hypothetical protein
MRAGWIGIVLAAVTAFGCYGSTEVDGGAGISGNPATDGGGGGYPLDGGGGADADDGSVSSAGAIGSNDCLYPPISYNDAGVDEYIYQIYGGVGSEYSPISGLNLMCFSVDEDCERYRLNLRLFLSTDYLPSISRQESLLLCDQGNGSGCAGPGIKLFLDSGEKPSADIDPGLLYRPNWKVEISDIAVKYNDPVPCQNAPGIMERPRIDLYGSLQKVRFLEDAEDTLESFIEVTDEEGRKVTYFGSRPPGDDAGDDAGS